MKAAHRLKYISEYYFSRKLKQIEQMRRMGRDILNLGVGSPDKPPSDEVIKEAIENLYEEGVHGYQSYRGSYELRSAMSDWYQKMYGVTLDPEKEVLPLLGSKEAILQIALAYLEPTDQVLIPNPGYPTYRSANLMVGADIKEYPLVPSNYWQPDWNYLSKVDYSKVKILWCNYPNMPTGEKPLQGTFDKLISLSIEHDFLLVNDNPYSHILYDAPQSILQTRRHPNIIELNSLSKSSNMAGWRVGMVVGEAQRIQEILQVKSNIDSGMFLPVQKAAVRALYLGEGWYANINRTYALRRKYAERIFRHLKCAYNPDQGGLFLWGKILDDIDSESFSNFILKNYDVFITPGHIFGSMGENHLRISLCQSESQFEKVLDRMDCV